MKSKPSLTLENKQRQSSKDALGAIALSPSANAALTCRTLKSGAFGGVELNGLIKELRKQINDVHNNEMGRPEAMLIAQAHTLEALFTKLSEQALMNVGEYIGAMETYMRLALKAQSQCATTLKVLGELKNPKQTAFIKQANVSQGHQQINNAPRAEIKNEQNELMEATNERLDTGTTGAPEGADTAMATVEAVNRAED